MLDLILAPLQVAEVIRDLCRVSWPTFHEAKEHYSSPSHNQDLYEMQDHTQKALMYVRAASGDLSHPNFLSALEAFDDECRRNKEDPWGLKQRKVRRTLARWLRESQPASSFKLFVLKLSNPVAYYRPSLDVALRRFYEATEYHVKPLYTDSVRETMSFLRPGGTDVNAAWKLFCENRGREYEDAYSNCYRSVERHLVRWGGRALQPGSQVVSIASARNSRAA